MITRLLAGAACPDAIQQETDRLPPAVAASRFAGSGTGGTG